MVSQDIAGRQHAFTLVEIMVVTALFGFVLAATAAMFFESTSIGLGISSRVTLNDEMRNLSDELSDQAREANEFRIYESFFTSGSPANFRSPGPGLGPTEYILGPGEEGSLCVLVSYGPLPLGAGAAVRPPVERLVGYFLDESDNVNGFRPLRRFVVDVPVADQNREVEELIPAEGNLAASRIIAERVAGMTNAQIFHNLGNRAISVNAQFSNEERRGRRENRIYSTTISPRG